MDQTRRQPEIEMLIDGSFREAARPSLPLRIAGAAVVIAVLAGVIAIAALALWVALALIPVALVAGLIAWAAIRFQLWRSGRSFGGRGGFLRR